MSSRAEAAQRWGSILVGAAVLVVVTWMTVEASGPPHFPKTRDGGASLGEGQAQVSGSARPTVASASPAASATAAAQPASNDLDGGLALSASAFGLGDAGLLMPSSAPRHVKLGVVLVAFAGAEGAPPNARSKREALELAERLGRDAQSDFHHAVSGGDPGSSDDIGRIPRGVLDPHTEVAVFALESGAISEVLETPRGYWIVKRID